MTLMSASSRAGSAPRSRSSVRNAKSRLSDPRVRGLVGVPPRRPLGQESPVRLIAATEVRHLGQESPVRLHARLARAGVATVDRAAREGRARRPKAVRGRQRKRATIADDRSAAAGVAKRSRKRPDGSLQRAGTPTPTRPYSGTVQAVAVKRVRWERSSLRSAFAIDPRRDCHGVPSSYRPDA